MTTAAGRGISKVKKKKGDRSWLVLTNMDTEDEEPSKPWARPKPAYAKAAGALEDATLPTAPSVGLGGNQAPPITQHPPPPEVPSQDHATPPPHHLAHKPSATPPAQHCEAMAEHSRAQQLHPIYPAPTHPSPQVSHISLLVPLAQHHEAP